MFDMSALIHSWTKKSGCWCSKFSKDGTHFGYCSEILCTASFDEETHRWHFIFHILQMHVNTTTNRATWLLRYLNQDVKSFKYIERIITKADLTVSIIYIPTLKNISITEEGICIS